MKKLAFLMALSSLALGAAAVQAQNILSNGSLDLTAVSSQLLATPEDWIVDANRAITGVFNDGASSEGFAGDPPTPDTDPGDMGLFFKAFTGNVANGPTTVNFYQDNPATAGLIYRLTGWAGAGASYLSAGSLFAVDFLNGASVIGGTALPLEPALMVPNGEPFNYKQFTVAALAPPGTTNVRARVTMLGGVPNPLGGDQAFVVDDFTLVAVPEPGTCALMGLALVGMGLAHRRRK